MTKGVRVDEKLEDNDQWPYPILKAGEYGKALDGGWRCVPPGTDYLGDITNHDIVEHADGTITVSPSILIRSYKGEWHGYLTNGIWREC